MGEALDDLAGAGHGRQRVGTEFDGGVVTGDRDDLLGGQGADENGHGLDGLGARRGGGGVHGSITPRGGGPVGRPEREGVPYLRQRGCRA